MRFSSTTKERRTGFTLIEILIIAPIVIIAISGFIALMVTIVGKVLLTRDQTAITYDTQNALNRIEQDVKLSAKFLTTTGALPSPQGSDSNFTGTAAFTNTSNTLILNALATDSNPLNWDRWLMYYDNQPNPCGDTETANRVFSVRIIYFIKNNSLWRRVYVPDWNTNTSSPDANTICTSSSDYYPWQKNTCSPGYTASRCQAEDERVMNNISALNVAYYTTPSSTTDIGAANAETATTIKATITGDKTTAGNHFSSSSSLRVNKLNSINTDASPLTAPVVSHAIPQPDTVTFSWPGISSAINYLVSYNINGGSWTNTTLNSSTVSYTVNANRGDTVSIKVAATNGTYTSSYGADAATMPLWTSISLQNNWVNFNSGFNTAQYTKTSSCRVFLRGLIKSGTTTAWTVIGNLPEGFRPQGTLVFQAATDPNVSGRIDVKANGDIVFVAGSNAWISLDNINFIPSSCGTNWSTSPFYNGWSNFGEEYENVHSTIDSMGRVAMQGLAKAGTTTNDTQMLQLGDISSSYIPPQTVFVPAGGSGWSEFWVWYGAGQVNKRGPQTSPYMGLQTLYYPGSAGSWSSPTLQNGWVNYGTTTYPSPSNLQYTKASDGVVTIRGMVKNGSTSVATTIANLPSGYRPTAQHLFAVPSNDNFSRIDIASSGNILFQTGSNAWVSLYMSFIAD